tara:strand:- start:1119 stop:3902 length:2784 start_codon:yes stop_codon:yes gene_type:complete
MKKSLTLFLFLSMCFSSFFSQKEYYSYSENGKFFAHCYKVGHIGKIYELKYYNVQNKKVVFTHNFNHFSKTPIEININYNGTLIALNADNKTKIVNIISGDIISEFDYPCYVVFPRLENYFLRYSFDPKKKKNMVSSYDAMTGEYMYSFKDSKFLNGYGQLTVSNNDRYIIQRVSANKFNVYDADFKTKLKSVKSNDFKIDDYNKNITFTKGTKTRTYSLNDFSLLASSDLNRVKRKFVKTKKNNNKYSKIHFSNEILSESGNFYIVPFEDIDEQSLLISSTQRNQIKELQLYDYSWINNINWINDSILVLNHQNNTTTLVNLLNLDKNKKIDFGLTKKRYINNKPYEFSSDYKYFNSTNKGILKNSIKIGKTDSCDIIKKLEHFSFLDYTKDNKNIIVRNNKTKQLGAVFLSGINNKNPLNVEYFDDSNSLFIEDILDDASVPADYNPHIIKDFKHISELTDSSEIMNLVLKNINFSDSNISINTHLIDDNGVYYYGASDENWKHIWCNLILKYNDDPSVQITDFEIIEHFNNPDSAKSISLVMDHSGSMGELRAKKLQLEVLNHTKTKNSNDEISLIKFDHKARVICYPEENKNKLKNSFEIIGLKKFGGGTSILDALNTSISVLKFKSQKSKKSIILVTDGEENCSKVNFNDVVKRAVDNDISIYTIGYGNSIDKNYLKSISSPTNGTYYQIYNSKDFEWIFNDINTKTRNYYEIKFKSNKIGDHKAVLKLCLNNGNNQKLSIDINNKPLDFNSNENDYLSFNENDLFNELELFQHIPDIEDFSDIKVSSDQLIIEKTDLNDSVNLVVIEEFNNIDFSNINFKFDKANISSSSKKVIYEVHEFLNKYPNINIEISGHTDNVGESNYNLKLSEKRANKIKDELISLGIDSGRINTIAHGENQPLFSNNSNNNKQMNRRVVFSIIK